MEEQSSMWVDAPRAVWSVTLLPVMMMLASSISAHQQYQCTGFVWEEAPIADGWWEGLALLPFLVWLARSGFWIRTWELIWVAPVDQCSFVLLLQDREFLWRSMSLASSSLIFELACANFSSAFWWQSCLVEAFSSANLMSSVRLLWQLLYYSTFFYPTQRMLHSLYGEQCSAMQLRRPFWPPLMVFLPLVLLMPLQHAKHTLCTYCIPHNALCVGCIYAPYKVNPNIFQFYFHFPDIFHHTSMHPLFCNIYEFYLIFCDFISSFIIYNNHLYLRQHFLFDSIWCWIC